MGTGADDVVAYISDDAVDKRRVVRAEEQGSFLPARDAPGDEPPRIDAGLFRQPLERPTEVLERNTVELGGQTFRAEVGEVELGVAVRSEQDPLVTGKAAFRAAEEKDSRHPVLA